MRTADARMAATELNRSAGRFLARVRGEARQSEMAARLAERLGLPVSVSALSGWENAARTVPGPVVVAVLAMIGVDLGELLAEPPARVDRLEGDVRAMGEAVATALEVLAGHREPAEAVELAARLRATLEGD